MSPLVVLLALLAAAGVFALGHAWGMRWAGVAGWLLEAARAGEARSAEARSAEAAPRGRRPRRRNGYRVGSA